jgi:hypothetical protein
MGMEVACTIAGGYQGPLGMTIRSAACAHRNTSIMGMANVFIITSTMAAAIPWVRSYREQTVYALMGSGITWATVR